MFKEFDFRSDKTLFWRAQKTLIVADLHLEKASFFAKSGQMLPPYDTKTTLMNLKKALQETQAIRLILLGDNFHDMNGPQRLSQKFSSLLPNIPIIWITGNHDPHLKLSTATGDQFVDYYVDESFYFGHKASQNPDHKLMEITGHFHPKASVRSYGQRISGPCFIYSSQRVILPSFGVFTGGLDIQTPDIQELFTNEYNITICWKDNVYSFDKTTYLKHAA